MKSHRGKSRRGDHLKSQPHTARRATALTSRLRCSQEGAAIIEVALLVPLLMILVFAGSFVARAGMSYARLSDVSEQTARYATRVSYDASAPVYRFRPAASDVIAFARAAAGSPVDVTVTPDPANARPGDQITVTISAHQGIGALAGVANALADVMHVTHPFPNGEITIASTTTMREE